MRTLQRTDAHIGKLDGGDIIVASDIVRLQRNAFRPTLTVHTALVDKCWRQPKSDQAVFLLGAIQGYS
jgi:hypothetical protein